MWNAITEAEIITLINESYERMTSSQRKIWDMIKIEPQKWQQIPYGVEGGGFWVVAIIGQNIIWFNDIEDGFNNSIYTKAGVIAEYLCNQSELEYQVQQIINCFK